MPHEAKTAAETLVRHATAGPDDPVLQRFFAMAAPTSEARLAFEAVREQVARDGRPDDDTFLRLVMALAPYFDRDLLELLSVRTSRVPPREEPSEVEEADEDEPTIDWMGAEGAASRPVTATPEYGGGQAAPATQEAPQADSRARRDRTDPADPERSLVAHLPGRAPQAAELSLVVRVSERPSGWAAASRLDRLTVVAGGAEVSILVQASSGLAPTGSLEQVLLVPAHGDSDPVRFTFHARSPGLHRVRVMAFAGGTFLTELELEVSVEPGGPAVEGEPVVATLDDLRGRPGEVTLQVRSDDGRTVFQLLSDSYLFEPVLAQASAGDPAVAVERTLDTLKQLAAGREAYSPATAARWMQETGIGLWEQVVPGLIKEQFWQLRDRISSFTIATSHDVVPWELLYPLRPGSDHGFLVEQFPVLRRVFGQQRCPRISIAPCTYVVSGRSPANARQEINALSAVLGAAGVVEELGELLDLVSSGQCGPLHFVCHNSFSPQAGSAIAMTGGPFVPGLLNSATVRNSLAARSPLVFLNACRTAGSVPEYTRMVGWAQQFMAAGAGAFVGTLWPVRSESAGAFAEVFYGHLQDGESLGRAALLTRRTVVREQPDPTWLAYTVYGDPHARTH
ncbi:CHAT domain-containing protein [Amycolatopsis sp. NPDC051758]|uniref:CHAT domain-containing protein n=1 Tax=Amycolatopsis sp. NPDC051758 TaxID=3363935 RepID=UPI00378CC38E